jgi:hypothetical protein
MGPEAAKSFPGREVIRPAPTADRPAGRARQAADYLNLIEPWWKVLRSLALKGRRFETWEQVAGAVERATAYWNAHRHPFVWGRRRRHRPRRSPGVAAVPGVR